MFSWRSFGRVEGGLGGWCFVAICPVWTGVEPLAVRRTAQSDFTGGQPDRMGGFGLYFVPIHSILYKLL